jgi:Ser/Thr protein kinase RdoA (MazF antagonist)
MVMDPQNPISRAGGSGYLDTGALTSVFPVTYSLLSADALLMTITREYDIGAPISCALLASGLNDTYLLRTFEGPFILRVYRAQWRSLSEIHYELELLTYLGRKGAPVATPIARRDGDLARGVRAPEGVRQMVLFTHAPGAPARLREADAFAMGRATADLHRMAGGFTSPQARQELDLDALISTPLRLAEPFFAHREAEWLYLRRLARKLKQRIKALAGQGLDWGVIHGDATERNAYVTDSYGATFFDFDYSGNGWRAYDLAAFLMHARKAENAEAVWLAYIRGYLERRTLGEADRAAIPLMLAARYYWGMGIRPANAGFDIGAVLDDAYLDRMVAYLRQWEAERIPD